LFSGKSNRWADLGAYYNWWNWGIWAIEAT